MLFFWTQMTRILRMSTDFCAAKAMSFLATNYTNKLEFFSVLRELDGYFEFINNAYSETIFQYLYALKLAVN